uniref:Stereocilin n=1 Tax=Falco tinnunculus TaxID=100819 RepID=A0A8C4ULM5_FALTI
MGGGLGWSVPGAAGVPRSRGCASVHAGCLRWGDARWAPEGCSFLRGSGVSVHAACGQLGPAPQELPREGPATRWGLGWEGMGWDEMGQDQTGWDGQHGHLGCRQGVPPGQAGLQWAAMLERGAGAAPARRLLIWSLPCRGFHHNISWDARGLGFTAGVLPAPPPLPSCLQPVPRAVAAVPQNQLSLLPPVLEAVCNDSIPGLPGVSNFTVYLYCNLFNSSRGSSQRPEDLGAACSNAAWYLSMGEGGSAWARACREHYPAQFNSTVCSNTSLRETPGPQQVLLEQLCADLAGPRSCSACIRWEDAWSCFLGSPMLWDARLCGSRSCELLPADPWASLSQLCGGPQPRAQMPGVSETVCPCCFQELVCTNASLLQLLGHPQPVVGARCQGALPSGRCLLQQLLALLPMPRRLDAVELCPDLAAYLLGLALQLPWCQEEAPGWAPHVNYLLRLLDRSLTASRREEAEQVAREQLSEAILLSSLLDNTSFWEGGLFAPGSASLQQGCPRPAVGHWVRSSGPGQGVQPCSLLQAVLWDLLQDSEGVPALEILAQVLPDPARLAPDPPRILRSTGPACPQHPHGLGPCQWLC